MSDAEKLILSFWPQVEVSGHVDGDLVFGQPQPLEQETNAEFSKVELPGIFGTNVQLWVKGKGMCVKCTHKLKEAYSVGTIAELDRAVAESKFPPDVDVEITYGNFAVQFKGKMIVEEPVVANTRHYEVKGDEWYGRVDLPRLDGEVVKVKCKNNVVYVILDEEDDWVSGEYFTKFDVPPGEFDTSKLISTLKDDVLEIVIPTMEQWLLLIVKVT